MKLKQRNTKINRCKRLLRWLFEMHPRGRKDVEYRRRSKRQRIKNERENEVVLFGID